LLPVGCGCSCGARTVISSDGGITALADEDYGFVDIIVG